MTVVLLWPLLMLVWGAIVVASQTALYYVAVSRGWSTPKFLVLLVLDFAIGIAGCIGLMLWGLSL
jgi:hypothetical protein